MSKNIFLSILVLAFTTLNGCDDTKKVDLNHGLVAYYPFNGDAMDYSSHSNDGTVVGASPTTDRFGAPNSAYYFNGINAEIEVPHHSTLNPLEGITFCAWVDFDDLSKPGSIIEKGRDISVGFYAIRYVPEQNLTAGIRFGEDAYPDGATGFAPTDVVLDTALWHFIALTYDGVRMRYYINGHLHDMILVSKTLGFTTEVLAIGRHPYPGYDYWFKGKIDDVRIYDRALTSREIRTLHDE